MIFAGRLFDTLELGKVVRVFSGTMAAKVVFRVDMCLARRKRALGFVSSPVLIENVHFEESLAAIAVRASIKTWRIGTCSRYCCHL
jgi:hypothetical protein